MSLPNRSRPRASDPGNLDADPPSRCRIRGQHQQRRFPYGSAPNVSPLMQWDPGSTEVVTFTEQGVIQDSEPEEEVPAVDIMEKDEPAEEVPTADITEKDDDDQIAQSHL